MTKKVRESTYLGYRVGVSGGSEAVVTARTRCWRVKVRECGEMLHRRCNIIVKGVVYKSYVRLATLHGSEAWCLKEIWKFYKGQR